MIGGGEMYESYEQDDTQQQQPEEVDEQEYQQYIQNQKKAKATKKKIQKQQKHNTTQAYILRVLFFFIDDVEIVKQLLPLLGKYDQLLDLFWIIYPILPNNETARELLEDKERYVGRAKYLLPTSVSLSTLFPYRHQYMKTRDKQRAYDTWYPLCCALVWYFDVDGIREVEDGYVLLQQSLKIDVFDRASSGDAP